MHTSPSYNFIFMVSAFIMQDNTMFTLLIQIKINNTAFYFTFLKPLKAVLFQLVMHGIWVGIYIYIKTFKKKILGIKRLCWCL